MDGTVTTILGNTTTTQPIANGNGTSVYLGRGNILGSIILGIYNNYMYLSLYVATGNLLGKLSLSTYDFTLISNPASPKMDLNSSSSTINQQLSTFPYTLGASKYSFQDVVGNIYTTMQSGATSFYTFKLNIQNDTIQSIFNKPIINGVPMFGIDSYGKIYTNSTTPELKYFASPV
jgi:hypothetical protein